MRPHAKSRSTGFSLVEVLVAVVILSFALLGTAGLTANSLKNTNTSYYRSQATFLADDILDRMRANILPARGSQYDISAGPTFNAGVGTMELYDCTEWSNEVAAALPGGEGTVSVVGGTVTITIAWDGGDSSFTTVSLL
ncbi:MAG: type IV pilus modification protein PilV [Gammaproteobacteria bacterium]